MERSLKSFSVCERMGYFHYSCTFSRGVLEQCSSLKLSIILIVHVQLHSVTGQINNGGFFFLSAGSSDALTQHSGTSAYEMTHASTRGEAAPHSPPQVKGNQTVGGRSTLMDHSNAMGGSVFFAKDTN